ncbi:MAG: GNAT family N-acetyltransferase [Gammaproteobacteria bacterium]|nr:GNAT family N-acetyltransferase [Gammaproteobacteria bacterium]MDD9958976.1 GNAT family N-acetyltransferase [Gammaproteobacteria bacterium]
MDMQQIESATRTAWPALEEVELEGGMLRYASGAGRRSNTLVPNVEMPSCPQKLLRAAEVYYRSKGQPAVVKVLTGANEQPCFSNLDSLLAQEQYQKESPTAVLALRLRNYFSMESPLLENNLEISAKEDWVRAWSELRELDPKNKSVHCQLVAKMTGEAYCLILKDALGKACATGMAVANQGVLGIFGIATAKEYQGLGLATELLSGLLNYGIDRGSEFAYLQVEKDNSPALALYRKFGFEQLYSYWYRVKELEVGAP